MVELGHPERPIQSPEDDILARDGFVRRLVAALINTETKRASGVVIGITGPWGSGKSSVLNLVAANIKKEHQGAIVVRFDPWLISGRNDLVSSFINELLSQLKKEKGFGDRLKSITNAIAAYGQLLAPLADIIAAGSSIVASGGLGFLEKLTKPKEVSLLDLREKLSKALDEAAIPIIVLIDEVDRVEDSEIRAIAQLVRAVADFPSMSYLLAFDAERVAQALGEGTSDGQRLERGRAYLEKIVQLQIPLPMTDDASIARMIVKELEALREPLSLPDNFTAVQRFEEMTNIVSGDIVSTPRDVSRLIGTYHALRGMLKDEVDWVDLLGYCVLLTKAPSIAARIKREPGMFLAQTLTRRDALREVGETRLTPAQRMELATGETNLSSSMKELIQELFPAFAEFGSHEKSHLYPLSNRRSLLTALHLGLRPGTHSRDAVTSLMLSSSDGVQAGLAAAYQEDSLDDLIDQMDDLYPTLSAIDHVKFWRGVAQFVKKPDCEWMTSFSPMNAVIRSLSDILFTAVRKSKAFIPTARTVFTNLRNTDENVLTAFWLRRQIFSLGLFGQSQRDSERVFFDAEQVTAIVKDMNASLRSLHLTGKLIPCRWDLQPVYTMVDAGAWDAPCKDGLATLLDQDRAVDGLALMFFGAHYTTEASTVDAICGIDAFLTASKRRLEEGTAMHESVRLSLEKAVEGLERTSA